MKVDDLPWDGIRDLYLEANAGSILPGFIHNLNNSTHAVDLQLELLQTKIPRIEAGSFPEAAKKLSRIAQSSKDLLSLIDCVSNRFLFTQNDNLQIDLESYFPWFFSYWRNNLFYKHRIDVDFTLEPDCPNLDTPPFILTLCLEEAWKNAVEDCRLQNQEGHYRIGLTVQPFAQGVHIDLTSPTVLSADKDPFEAGFTTKQGRLGYGLPLIRHYADLAGWDVSLVPTPEGTVFCLQIPDKRTRI
ncbi:MAG: hypothetical protein ACOC0U_06435 [Desulfovibrionales bacterium]